MVDGFDGVAAPQSEPKAYSTHCGTGSPPRSRGPVDYGQSLGVNRQAYRELYPVKPPAALHPRAGAGNRKKVDAQCHCALRDRTTLAALN